MEMDFKILLLVLCITFASVQGAIPRCCLRTSPLPKEIVMKAYDYTIQNADGPCEIEALVLYITWKSKSKIVCAPLWQEKYLKNRKSK